MTEQWTGLVKVDDERELSITITHEGIILDLITGEDEIRSMAMMFDEWADFIEGWDE